MKREQFLTELARLEKEFSEKVNRLQASLLEGDDFDIVQSVVFSEKKRDNILKEVVGFGGRSFCLVPVPLPLLEAERLCEKLGGKLASCLGEDDKAFFAETILKSDEYSSAWVGQAEENGGGVGLTISGAGRFDSVDAKESRWFILELL